MARAVASTMMSRVNMKVGWPSPYSIANRLYGDMDSAADHWVAGRPGPSAGSALNPGDIRVSGLSRCRVRSGGRLVLRLFDFFVRQVGLKAATAACFVHFSGPDHNDFSQAY